MEAPSRDFLTAPQNLFHALTDPLRWYFSTRRVGLQKTKHDSRRRGPEQQMRDSQGIAPLCGSMSLGLVVWHVASLSKPVHGFRIRCHWID
jgi:hypothetical protein